MNPNKTNKLKLLMVGAFVAFSQFAFGQSSTYEKMLVSSDLSSRYDVRGSFMNSDGNIVTYGYQTKNNYDPFFVEVNPSTGDTVRWADVEGTLYPERMRSMVELPTGGYIGVGYTARNSNNYPWIIKLKANGDTVFTKSFHTYSNTFSNCTNTLQGYFNDVIVNGSGDLIVTGQNDNCWQYSTLIAQLDTANGTIDWVNGTRTLNVQSGITVESYRGNSIALDGSDYVVVGGGYGGSSNRGTIIKFDSSGDTVWTTFASTQDLYDVIKSSDGNYYATGESNPFSISSNAAFVKVSSTGSVGLTKHISPTGTDWNYGYSIAEGPGTNEYLIGGVSSWTNEGSDQTLHSVSSSGTVNYTKHFGFGDWVERTYVVVNGNDIYLTGNENYGWNAWQYYNLYDNISNNPPHQLRPTISKHNSDGEIDLLNLHNNRYITGGSLCQNTRLWKYSNYSNFSYSSTDMSSSDFCCSSWTNEVEVSGSGSVTFEADDKNGDTRTVTISFDATPQPTIAGYDAFYNITYSACSGDSLLLVVTGGTNSTFEWFVNGNSTSFSDNDSVYVSESTYLYVKETTPAGCTGTTYQNITINTDQVAITSQDYPQKFNSSVGNGSDTNTRQPNAFKWAFNQDIEAWIAPIGGYKQQNAQQYLVKASELTALGLNEGSKISKIGFDFLDGYTSTVREMQIRIKETSANTLSLWNSFSSISTQFDDYWYYPSISSGVNYFPFSSDYTWDGTSNLIIQVSYVNNSWSSDDLNPRVKIGDVGYDATLIGYGTQTNSIGQSNPPAYKKTKYRPNIYFEAAKAPLQDTIVGCGTDITLEVENSGYQFLQWSTGSSNSSVSVSSAGQYIVQMLDANFCVSVDTMEVLFSAPSVTTTATLTKGCDGDNSTITASGNYDTYIWSNGGSGNSVTVSETGSYIVTAFDEYSCTAKDTINIEFAETPQIVVKNQGPAAYTGGTLPGTYGGSNATYLGSYSGSHYYFISSWAQWDVAQAYANSLGGHLARPETQGEADWIHTKKQSVNCCDGTYIDIEWKNNKWVYSNGEEIAINYFNNSYASGSGSYVPSTNYTHMEVNGTNWQALYYTDTRPFLIEFDPTDQVVISGDAFCDSVQLSANSDYDSYEWTDNSGNVFSTSKSVWISASETVELDVSVTKSDGTTCDLTSGQHAVTINESPVVTLTNNTGTIDYDGTNAISLTAGSSGSNTTYEWSNGATTAAISVTAEGTYQVVGTENGCSDSVSLRIFEPIYVDDDGSDSNGDGSLSNPYASLSKGYAEVSDGGKIYVLPGTYEEELTITKSVNIMSNYVRLGDTSAIANTIIEADNGEYALKIKPTSQLTEPVVIQGFTITGKSNNQYSAAIDVESATQLNGEPMVILRNLLFEDNSVQWGWSEPAAALSIRYSSGVLLEESSFIDNNPSQINNPSVVSVTNSSTLIIKRCLFEDNYSNYSIISLWNGSNTLEVENSYFTGNIAHDGLIRARSWDNDVTLNHITINESDNVGSHVLVTEGNSEMTLENSVVFSSNSGTSLWYGESNSSFNVENSVIKVTNGLIHPSANISSFSSSNLIEGDPQLNIDGSLSNTSQAIGLGSSNVQIDFKGLPRPNPAGSNSDAGAFESSKAIGDFEILLTQCGYLLEATVLNSNAYSVSWLLNSDTVSTSESFTATTTGTYVAYVQSTDRGTTISKSIVLSNPLRFVTSMVKNNCSGYSYSNGEIQWTSILGGTPIINGNEYWSEMYTSSGTYQGSWSFNNSGTGVAHASSLAADTYLIMVKDGTGCEVWDTVTIEDQDQGTYYVSNSGNNSNDGTSELQAFETIEYALTQICDEDTIIILDGIYYEDSLEVNRSVVIGSKYLIDGVESHIANTIIDGQDDGWIMRWLAGSNAWADTSTNQLVGLTIQNGNSKHGSGYSGGLSVWNSRVVKVSDVVFYSNHSSVHHGGGMYTHSYSYVELDNVLFKENSADGGGAIMSQNSRMRWLNVEFDNNQSTNNDGMAIWIDNSFSFFSNGVYVHDHNNTQLREVIRMNMWDNADDIVLKNWRVQNNTVNARVFAISQQNSSRKLFIENALITDNTSTNGGPGLLIRDSRNQVNIINSTIANNTSITSTNNTGAAMIVVKNAQSDLTVNILNSIVQNSTSTYTVAENGGNGFDLNIEGSFITGGTGKVEVSSNSTKSYGSTNLNSGLYFVDAANGDYNLSPVSTLIGAGLSSKIMGGSTISPSSSDLAGNSRPLPSGTNPDVGAYESVEGSPQIGIASVITNNGFCQTNSGAITANLLNYSGTAAYTWSSSTYPTWSWNNTQSATGLLSGDYKVVAFDALTGTKLDSTEITISTLPTISIVNTSNPVTCFGDDDGDLIFEIYGGNPLGGSQYTYSVDYLQSLAQATGVMLPSNGSWFDSDNSTSNRTNKYNADNWNGNPIYQGKYYVSVTDQDGCTFSDTVEVGFTHELPEVNITTLASDGTAGLTSMCSGTGNTISLTANVTGGGGTNAFLWNNSSTAQTVGVAQSDEYIVEVTDQYTCVGKDTIDIYFQTAPQLVVHEAAGPLFTGTSITGVNSDFLGMYGSKSYYVIKENLTWPQARDRAAVLGGSLVNIEDQSFRNWIRDQWTDYHCCGVWVGAFFNESTQQFEWTDGSPFTLWTGTSGPNGSGSSVPYVYQTDGGGIYNRWSGESRYFLVEFAPLDAPVVFNQAFCDSVELKAKPYLSSEGQGFTEIYWTDSQGDTINDLEYKTFYADQDITLHGVFTRSDGQTCEISSTTYSFDVYDSPNLVVTNYSGTVDLLGGDSIVLVASTDAGTVSWIDASGTVVNNDTLFITAPGNYTAKATTANCESLEEIQIYEPIYVAKTGSDATGDGSFASPYLTIQKGIDVATEGQKIYVLPGTYEEGQLDFETSSGSGVYKSVFIASDFVRLGSASAITSTKIDADGDEYLIYINGSNSSVIQGFTLTGQVGGSDWEGALLRLNSGASLTFKDLVISGNVRDQSYSPEAQLMNVRNNSHPVFENVVFKNNGGSSLESRQMAFVYNNASATFINCTWKDNYVWEQIVRVQNYSNALFENNVFVDNGAGDWGVVAVEESNCSIVFSNSTIVNNSRNGSYPLLGISGSNNSIYFHNSILGNTGNANTQIRNNTSTTNKFVIRNSVLPFGSNGATNASKLTWDDDGSSVFSDPQLNASGTLKATSPAIGLGSSQSFTFNGVTYQVPTTDITGAVRPIPSGSNPDAGAYESVKAQGDFDVLLSQCGYLLDATVLNTNAYSVAWLYNGDTVSSLESFTASALGTYTASVISTDRGDTLVESISLADPLRYDLALTKNNCTDIVGGNNGRIEWGRPQGGTPNSNNNYYSWIENSSGGYVWGSPTEQINHTNDWNGTHSVDGLSADIYYVIVSDATGCQRVDTVVIEDQDGGLYYVSTQGDNSNDGSTASMAFETIEYALTQVCDQDTIILLDGVYYEDSLHVTTEVVIASMFLFDQDTSHISNTIIDGGNNGWIMAWEAGSSNWSDTTSNQLVGLTIQNGNSTNSSYAGGLSVWDSRPLTISHVRFRNNQNTQNQGGALWLRNNSYVQILNSDFIGNSSSQQGAAFYASYPRVVMHHVEIRDNTGGNDGGLIRIDGTRYWDTKDVHVVNNTSNSNRLMFINMWDLQSNAVFDSWVVENNSTSEELLFINDGYDGKQITFQNLLMVNNTAQNRPGLVFDNYRGTINIVNSTIYGNSSTNHTGNYSAQIFANYPNESTTPTINIFNSIVDANNGYAFSWYDYNWGSYSFNVNIENSYIEGGTSSIDQGSNGTKNYGTTNISSGIYFVNAANGDYTPTPVSSAIGAGASAITMGNIALTAPLNDLYGNARPIPSGTDPDLGAIEVSDSIPNIGIAAVVTNNGFCQTTSGAITANLLNYSGSDGVAYSWTNLSNPSQPFLPTTQQTGLASGDYAVVASNATDGTVFDSIVVTVSTAPAISIVNTSTDVTCFGDDDGELSFEIYGGNPLGGSQYTYSIDYQELLAQADGVVLGNDWYNTDNNSNNRNGKYISDQWNVSPNYQGSYYVTVTDEDGCTFSDTVKIGYEHVLPVVNITTLASDGTSGLTSMCSGTGNTINLTANVTGGGGSNSYTWSNASTAQTVTVATTSEYYVEVEDQFTCVGKDTIDIYFQTAPQLVYLEQPAFSGGPLTGTYSNTGKYLGSYNGHEYYIVESAVSWSAAKSAANALGGYLAVPNDAAENSAIYNMVHGNTNPNMPFDFWIGIEWDGSKWVDVHGNEIQYSMWWGNTSQSAQHGLPYHNNGILHGNDNGAWYNYNGSSYNFSFIVEFSPQDAPVVFNQTFCDSIELKAKPFVSADGLGFTEIYWTDSQGDTINDQEYKAFYADSEITLHGVFTRSDGQVCSISSTQYSFDIFNSPNLVVTNYSGSIDLLGGDTIVLVASTDIGTVSWVDSAGTVINNDTLYVTQPGTYMARALTSTCETTEEIKIDQPLYVAKTGNDATGDGTFGNPYLTIQKGVNEAASGQKIYVLPGVYNETVDIDKSVNIESDFTRLGNVNAKNNTVIDGNGSPCIEIDNVNDDIVVVLNGFKLRDASHTSNSNQGAITINQSSNTTFTLMNSSITQSANSGACCGRGGIIQVDNATRVEIVAVDIYNNGSLTQEARFPINLNWVSSGVLIENTKIRSNGFTQWLFNVNGTDLTLKNTIIAENTSQWGDRDIFNLQSNSSLIMYHGTVYGNDQGQAAGLVNIDWGSPTIEIYNSILAVNEVITTSDDYTVSNSVLKVGNVFGGTGSNLGGNNIQSNIQLQTGYSLPATSPAIGLGDISFGNVREDLNGWTRPLPAGSNPDAGAIEDSLAVGEFDFFVSNCGNYLDISVLNTNSYSISVSGPANFSSTNTTSVLLNVLGQYTVTVYDSLTSESVTKTLNYNDPLNTGFISVQNACPSNNGLGQIMVGDFTGGTDLYPTQQYHDYNVYIVDTNQTIVWSHPVHQGSGSRWDTWLQAGEYYIQLTDGSGCSVYDTVVIEDLLGSKYYISTTGSDANTGEYFSPLATIQEALNRTCDGDTIVLFDGEYFENVDYTSSYLPYVTIASEFIEDGQYSHIANTIVNGMDEDPVFDISQHGNSSDTIIFVGFTITNGKSSNWYGGGGISINYSEVALKDMVVTGNRSGHDGGGIGMDGGELNLWNTLIYDNIASGNGGGIRANYMERLDGHGSTIIENNKSNSSGGGISYGHGHWGSTEDFYIKGFEIINNSANYEGGGLHISNWGNNNSDLEIEDIKIINNRSNYGSAGGMYISNNGEDAIMSNVIIASNRSNGPGGMKINDVDLDIVHSTIYANPILDGTSSNDQIELHNNANVLLLNSAVGGQQNVGNSTAHTFYFNDWDTTCDLTIVNSLVSGGVNSMDNSYNSPVTGTPIGQALYLVDPGQGDYMLSPVSQGLGAGVSTYSGITMPYLDIEGTARPNPTGSNPDVGAVESPLDTAVFGAAYEIRNNIACDPTYGRLKVIPLNGSGSYKYELDDLTGSATFSDQLNVSSWTYSSLYSGDYLVTITDLSSSSVFTDTVTITGKDSLNLILTYNDIFCAGEDNGSISAIVSGGDGYYDYTWTTATNSSWPKSNKLNNLYPDEYFVTVKDGDNCFIEDSVTLTTLHSLPAVTITGNINKGGSIVQTTNPQVRACAGDIVTLDAGAGFVSYNWTTIDQLNSWNTQTLSASYEDGFYVTVIDSFGCANSDTAQVFYVQSPSIFASNVNTNIGSSYQQVTSYVEGSNQSTGFNSEPKPYGASERFAKMQFIIPASELIAEGLTDQTSINSLGFEVDLASGSPVQNFKIKLKNTTSNQVGYTFETGLTEVYSFNILTAGEGWNTHEFDQDFVWDGTKNLLVQVEYSNVAFTNASNSYLIGHQTSYTSSSVVTNWSSSVSNQTTANNTFNWRPNMKFGIDKVQATDTLRVCDFTLLNTTDDYDTYSWLVNGTSQSTQLRYSMNSPNVVVLKTVDAASSCTMYSDTVQVLLDTTPSVFVTSPSLIGCIGDSVIASVDTVKSNLTYAWSNGVQDTIASFTESGDYYIYAISPSGCQGVDTVNVSINIPPDVVMELNGRVLTSTDGSLIADNSSCDTTLILPYFSSVDTLSPLNASEWDTYSSNFLEWEYQQGWDSLVDYTGPTYDADSNFYGGFYQFDPASLTDQNKVGYLELGCINLLGMSDPYISFAYHMVDVYADSSNTADQMGSLEFQVKTAGDAQWTTLWLTSGTEQAYTWVNKTIGLSSFSNQTIQVRWKGTAGVGGPRSEIGLDNISVTDASANLSNVSGRISPEIVCEGDSLFASTVSNGTSNFTFLWSNGETTSGIELHTSGWYSVQVTDDKSCGISTDSVYITVNPAPNNMLTLSDTTQYCFGVFDSIVISAVPGYANYEWIVGQQLSSPSATYCDVGFILTDSYGDGWNNGTIQIKDGSGTVLTTLGSGFTNGYSFIDSVSLVSGSSYTIDVANGGGWPSEMGLIVILGGDTIASYANTSSTSTGTVMASITPNCEIQGSTNTNVSLVSTIVVDSISLGTTSYYVTITDSIGCKAISEAVDLIERVNPALSFVSSPVLCNGDTTGAIDLTATGNGGFVYDWSNGANSSSLSGLSTGWYSVAVTDSFSCETIDSVFVNEPIVLSLTQTITSDVNCFGGSDGFANYTFTGGVGGYVYSWSDSTNSWSSDSLNLTGAPAGLYFLNASDSNGCYVLDTVGIDEPSLLVLTIDSTSNLSCYQNADGYVSASVVGGFGSYSYYIDGMIATSLTIDSLNAGTHVVSVVDDNGCSDSASFTLTEPALLTATTNVSQYLGGIQVSCNGATDGSIDVFVNGGTLPYSFLWTDGDTTEDRSNIGAGSYSMTVTDEQGCTVTINEVITEPTLLVTASTVDSLDCYGASDGLINYTFSGATAPYITSWSSSTGSTVDSVLATFQVDMNGASINTGGIELITNSGFNYGMNVVSVLEDSIYRITIPVAVGTSIDYRFFNGSTPESVSSSCGVNIGGTFYRNVTINSDTTLVAVQFSSCTTVGSAYSGAMTGSVRTLTGLSAGSYSLSVSDVNGCATQMTDVLLQPDSISITATVYDASCPQTPDGYVDVTATGGSGNLTYLWSTGDTTQDLTAAYGYHTIYVYDDKGCMDSATFLIDAPFPYNDEEICVVTVDTTGVNLVVWEKTPNQRTADYIILKENASSQYVSVGNNSYQNMSTWSDQNSNPKVQPWRYRLVLQDSCGNYSDTSDYHATIHLQASQGVAQNEVNLQWTAYEGKQVQTYYIYRWLSPINRVLIDSVSSNVQTYTDIYPVNTAITALLYEVGAKFTNGGCSPSAGKQSSYVTSMSNVLDWGTDGGLPIGTEEWVNTVLEHDLEMYPNPTQGKLNLDLKGAWEDQRNIQIVITDMTGRRIGERTLNGSGRAQFDFAELPAGVYFLQIITEEGRTIVKRFERIN